MTSKHRLLSLIFIINCLPKSGSTFSVTEPDAPPTNVQGFNTSSTSILVQWSDVPAADQNGIILSYTVTYKTVPDGSPQTKVVSAPKNQLMLTGLNEYTNYSITVFASTVKGAGNVNAPIIVITDEDSKFSRASQNLFNF